MILTCSRVRPTAFLYISCAFLLCRPCPQRDCRSHGPRLQCLHHRHPGIQKIATSRHCHSHHSMVCKGSQRLTSLDALKWDGHRDGLWLCKHSCSWEMLRSLSNSPISSSKFSGSRSTTFKDFQARQVWHQCGLSHTRVCDPFNERYAVNGKAFNRNKMFAGDVLHRLQWAN